MEVKQIAELMNEVTLEVLGTENMVQEDLENIVDVGRAIENAQAYDKYVKSLVNHIGKVEYVNRIYSGFAPSVLKDGWEYGSIKEKIAVTKLPEATETWDWELEENESYDDNIFTPPNVAAKFFNREVTFTVPISIAERQVKQSFSNPTQLNSFISMIQTAIKNSMTIKLNKLISMTMCNFIGETMFDEYKNGSVLGDVTAKSGVKAVNLLYLYNQQYGKSLTAAKSITDPDFIRFAAYTIGMYKDRVAVMYEHFNIGEADRFTEASRLHSVLLSDFRRAADVFLQSTTFHEEYTKLVDSEVIPYWQAPGDKFAFGDITKINIKTSGGHEVEVSGILGFLWDHEALGVTNMNQRVKSHYVNSADFTNYWYKMDAGYFNDFNENAIVFFVA